MSNERDGVFPSRRGSAVSAVYRERTLKRLLLARHAKSDWNDPRLTDRERPLNGRGEKNAPEMGRRLLRLGVHPGRIICSSAVRALATARLLAHELGVAPRDLTVLDELYAASPGSVLQLIHGLDADDAEVMLVGHNPECTACANLLLGRLAIDNVPTCGVVALEFPVSRWADVAPGGGRLLFFDYPKKPKG